jgi:hypothetical protein
MNFELQSGVGMKGENAAIRSAVKDATTLEELDAAEKARFDALLDSADPWIRLSVKQKGLPAMEAALKEWLTTNGVVAALIMSIFIPILVDPRDSDEVDYPRINIAANYLYLIGSSCAIGSAFSSSLFYVQLIGMSDDDDVLWFVVSIPIGIPQRLMEVCMVANAMGSLLSTASVFPYPHNWILLGIGVVIQITLAVMTFKLGFKCNAYIQGQFEDLLKRQDLVAQREKHQGDVLNPSYDKPPPARPPTSASTFSKRMTLKS